MLDYVIVRQRDLNDVNITRAMRGSGCWSDHLLVRSTVKMQIAPCKRGQRKSPPKKLNTAVLACPNKVDELQRKLKNTLPPISEDGSIEGAWSHFRDCTFAAAAETLGFVKRKHQDWFDENDEEIEGILNTMHTTHRAYIACKHDAAKKGEYLQAKRSAQRRLRMMKNNWWEAKAAELQEAADQNNARALHQGLKAVYGPRVSGGNPVLTADGSSLLTDKGEIMNRWMEHFNQLLNKTSNISNEALDATPNLPLLEGLEVEPCLDEVGKAIKQLPNGKAPGSDRIPPEIYKFGGAHMVTQLTNLFARFWRAGEVPQELKDASIVHLYKRKGNRSNCDNHRGISLLSIAGKILARVILNRLLDSIVDNIYPESQCGFRRNRSTSDMIFAMRQLQEKCKEQNMGLYTAFVDLTKAFDTVSRTGLWDLLRKAGCPEKIVTMIRSFHDRMMGRIFEGGEYSNPFGITNGAKQGCVLAPTLFGIVFASMLSYAFRDLDVGVYIQVRTDGKVFNIRRFSARTKLTELLIRDFLFADDCALTAHTLEDLQNIMNRFADAAVKFGLTISLKKTEVLFQPAPGTSHTDPVLKIGDTQLNSVKNFSYLGSIMSHDTSLDMEITNRIAKASAAFGLLSHTLWNKHGIKLQTKIKVYNAAIVPCLLYGSGTWTLYKRQIRQLDSFHMKCLRRICGIKWQQRIPNTEVLEKCGTTGIEAIILQNQLRWAGHVVRMDSGRIPKALFYGQLKDGHRSEGRPYLRYKDSLKHSLKQLNIDHNTWETKALDRASWRSTYRGAINNFELKRIQASKDKRARRKKGIQVQPASGFVCEICRRQCSSKAGLASHSRAHQRRKGP